MTHELRKRGTSMDAPPVAEPTRLGPAALHSACVTKRPWEIADIVDLIERGRPATEAT
jgi:hypothetical protein